MTYYYIILAIAYFVLSLAIAKRRFEYALPTAYWRADAKMEAALFFFAWPIIYPILFIFNQGKKHIWDRL